MRRTWALAFVLAAAWVAVGCRSTPRFSQPMKLGGVEVSAETLNEGYTAYMHSCYACHGEKGDGRGPSSYGMRPPPRDFSSPEVIFKFAGVPAGELPTDAALMEIIRRGLAGTPMLPWDISERERHAIVQYVKTLSPRWTREVPGEPVKPDEPDPWTGRIPEAVAVGEKIYHLAGVEMDKATQQPKAILAGCNACHPSYLTGAELEALSQKVLGQPVALREQLARPLWKESEYKVGETKVGFLPTDFLFHSIKNGSSPTELFVSIAAGIGGTAMPTWKGQVKDADIWALAHYVRHLASLRDTAQATALRAKLAAP